jgi:hypothetical protein
VLRSADPETEVARLAQPSAQPIPTVVLTSVLSDKRPFQAPPASLNRADRAMKLHGYRLDAYVRFGHRFNSLRAGEALAESVNARDRS